MKQQEQCRCTLSGGCKRVKGKLCAFRAQGLPPPPKVKPGECMHAQMQCTACGDTFSRQDGVQ